MRSDGERLDPKIQDFARWRDTIAHKARERNIPMENLRRFDQAHAPAYKLKDLKMMERGHAPESVRNRVERVNEREIFRPSRPEGVQSAAESTPIWCRSFSGILRPQASAGCRVHCGRPQEPTAERSREAPAPQASRVPAPLSHQGQAQPKPAGDPVHGYCGASASDSCSEDCTVELFNQVILTNRSWTWTDRCPEAERYGAAVVWRPAFAQLTARPASGGGS